MYWIIFLFLLRGALYEVISKKKSVRFFFLAFILLIILTALRKGQGADYYNYRELFDIASNIGETSPLLLFTKSDFLFYFFCFGCAELGMSYEVFNGFISALTVILTYKFFSISCRKSAIAIFIFYSCFYLIYYFSALRQGIALSIILSFAYPAIIKKKYIVSILWIILGAGFHASCIVFLLAPLFARMRIRNTTWIIIVILSILISFFSSIFVSFLPSFILVRASSYLDSTSGILSVIIRLIMALPLFFIGYKKYDKDSELNVSKNLVLIGFSIYCILSFSDLIAARSAVYYLIFITLSIPDLIDVVKNSKIKLQYFFYYVIICVVMLTKDINGFIDQGDYRNCNFITYPYLNVFDTDKDVMYYRQNLGFADK